MREITNLADRVYLNSPAVKLRGMMSEIQALTTPVRQEIWVHSMDELKVYLSGAAIGTSNTPSALHGLDVLVKENHVPSGEAWLVEPEKWKRCELGAVRRFALAVIDSERKDRP